MKTFLDLLATELHLAVEINGKISQAGILDHLTFDASDLVTIDGVQVLPQYQYLAQDGVLKLNEPFYCWLHRASNQGWLLMPQ